MKSSKLLSEMDHAPRPSALPSLPITAISLLIAILGLVLRLDASRDDLWVDELHTAWVVDGAWTELPSRAGIGNQPPLYFAIVKVVIGILGLSEISLRAVSLLAGCGLILTSWCFTWRVTTSHTSALIAVAFVALDTTCIFYASEARAYALLQFVLAWYAILVMKSDDQGFSSVLRAALAALSVHLQFTSLLFLLPIYLTRLIYAAVSASTARSRNFFSLGIEVGIVFVLCIPLSTQVLEIAGRGQAWSTFVPSPSIIGLWKMFPWTPAIISFAALLVRSEDREPTLRPVLGWLSWMNASSLLFGAFVALLGIAPLFFRRYLLGAEWPLLMLPGLVLSWSRRSLRYFLAIVVLGSIVWESKLIAPELWRHGRLAHFRSAAWSEAIDSIRGIDPQGDLPLFVASGFIESRQLTENSSELLREYCRLPIATLYRTPHSLSKIEPISSVIPRSPPQSWVEEIITSSGGIWLVRVPLSGSEGWRNFGDRLLQTLKDRTGSEKWRINVHLLAGITILEIRLMRDSAP